MPEIISINGEGIGVGEHAKIYLKIARLPTHTNLELPVHVYRGEQDGPVLLLTGGLHGDEINGIEIIRRLINTGQIIPKIGTVIALPIVNIYGFLLNVRGVPDGKDINRSFPGAKGGSLARLLAYTLMKELVPLADMGIDFHTGGASRANYPQIRCSFYAQDAREMAKVFAAPVVLHSTLISKSFRHAAHKKGVPILVYEAGESLRLDESGIDIGIDGTLRVMHHLGMIDESPESPYSKMFRKSTWIRANRSGLFSTEMALGDVVAKKGLVGEINDPFGGRKSKLLSLHDGKIIGLNNNPIVHKGDAIIHLAYN